MLDGFKKFILRGNVVELAVGVMIGAAFGAIVTSMSKDIITPLIGIFGGTPDFSSFKVGPVGVGSFVNAIIAFLLQASVIYFVIVLPMNRLIAMTKKGEEPAVPMTKSCSFCATDIPIKATRCPHCTSNLTAV